MSTNRIRILSEVVALDAWHDPFSAPNGTSAVFVELCFKESRIGGDLEEFPFTFRLSLKKAELKVIVDKPLRIVRSSIAAGTDDGRVSRTLTSAATIQSGYEASGGGRLGGSGPHVELGASAAASGTRRHDDARVLSSSTPKIICVGEPCEDRAYKWCLEPAMLDTLRNHPWDKSHERLRVRYDTDDFKRIPPEIRAEITCRFEDLSIEDIEPKEKKFAEQVANLYRNDTRLKAVKQHLKYLLREADLHVGGMDNRFATVLLGSVIAASEPE